MKFLEDVIFTTLKILILLFFIPFSIITPYFVFGYLSQHLTDIESVNITFLYIVVVIALFINIIRRF